MEKRLFTRVPFRAQVVVTSTGNVIRGETENVSLKGMYLQDQQTIPIGEEVDVEISLPDPHKDKILRAKAVAVRYQDGGTGYRFGAMDFDSFFALQEIVTMVSGTPGQVMTEIMRYVNKS